MDIRALFVLVSLGMSFDGAAMQPGTIQKTRKLNLPKTINQKTLGKSVEKQIEYLKKYEDFIDLNEKLVKLLEKAQSRKDEFPKMAQMAQDALGECNQCLERIVQELGNPDATLDLENQDKKIRNLQGAIDEALRVHRAWSRRLETTAPAEPSQEESPERKEELSQSPEKHPRDKDDTALKKSSRWAWLAKNKRTVIVCAAVIGAGIAYAYQKFYKKKQKKDAGKSPLHPSTSTGKLLPASELALRESGD